MSKADELQKYQWGAMGMREDNSQFGAMYYFRGADVENAISDLEQQIIKLEADVLFERTRYQGMLG